MNFHLMMAGVARGAEGIRSPQPGASCTSGIAHVPLELGKHPVVALAGASTVPADLAVLAHRGCPALSYWLINDARNPTIWDGASVDREAP